MGYFTSQIIHLDRHLPSYTNFPLNLDGREQLNSLSIKSLENISCPIVLARSLLSNSAKLLNLRQEILTLSQERLKDLFSLLITLCTLTDHYLSGPPKNHSLLASHPTEPHMTDQRYLDLQKTLNLNIASYVINTLASPHTNFPASVVPSIGVWGC